MVDMLEIGLYNYRAVLSGIGMHQVQPDSMQITVKAYLFPCVLGGWNSPIKSMDINPWALQELEKFLCYTWEMQSYIFCIWYIFSHSAQHLVLDPSSSNFF